MKTATAFSTLAALSASLPPAHGASKVVPKEDIPALEFHPLANTFPLDEGGIPELGESFLQSGQREDIVIYEGKILDGRRRYLGCVHASVMPRLRNFNTEIDGESPAQFVTDLNLKRRQLNAGQKAAAAVELIPFFQSEADAQNKSGSTEQAGGDGEQKPHYEQDEYSQAAPRKPGRSKTGGKAATKAAKATGAKTRSVEKAAALKKKHPKAFKAVKEGRKSLGAAVTEADYDAAINRIKEICGGALAKAIKAGERLKNKQEVIQFAKLRAEKMKDIQGLIETGNWSVKDALQYKEKDLNKTHKIADLLARSSKEGGKYDCKIDGFTVSAKRDK